MGIMQKGILAKYLASEVYNRISRGESVYIIQNGKMFLSLGWHDIVTGELREISEKNVLQMMVHDELNTLFDGIDFMPEILNKRELEKMHPSLYSTLFDKSSSTLDFQSIMSNARKRINPFDDEEELPRLVTIDRPLPGARPTIRPATADFARPATADFTAADIRWATGNIETRRGIR
jgi:hypothetical protein